MFNGAMTSINAFEGLTGIGEWIRTNYIHCFLLDVIIDPWPNCFEVTTCVISFILLFYVNVITYPVPK